MKKRNITITIVVIILGFITIASTLAIMKQCGQSRTSPYAATLGF